MSDIIDIEESLNNDFKSLEDYRDALSFFRELAIDIAHSDTDSIILDEEASERIGAIGDYGIPYNDGIHQGYLIKYTLRNLCKIINSAQLTGQQATHNALRCVLDIVGQMFALYLDGHYSPQEAIDKIGLAYITFSHYLNQSEMLVGKKYNIELVAIDDYKEKEKFFRDLWNKISERKYDDIITPQKENKALKTENTSLHKTIKTEKEIAHSAEHSLFRLREILIKNKERENIIYNELVDLRTLVFNLQNNLYVDDKESKPDLCFPIELKEKNIIIGGHISWIKQMKELVDNSVIFIDTSKSINEDVFKDADCVWIQTNAISHSSVAKMQSIISEKTAIRYFTHASAKLCALQMIQ